LSRYREIISDLLSEVRDRDNLIPTSIALAYLISILLVLTVGESLPGWLFDIGQFSMVIAAPIGIFLALIMMMLADTEVGRILPGEFWTAGIYVPSVTANTLLVYVLARSLFDRGR